MIKNVLIVLAVVVIVVVGRLVIRLRSPEFQRRRAEVAAAAAQLREQVLSRSLGRDSTTGAGGPRGVVMDWAVGDGLATIVALDDGTVSLYLIPGGGTIGAATREPVAQSGSLFRASVSAVTSRLTPLSTFSASRTRLGGVLPADGFRDAVVRANARARRHVTRPSIRRGLSGWPGGRDGNQAKHVVKICPVTRARNVSYPL